MSVASEAVINTTGDLRANLVQEEDELWQLDNDTDWAENFGGDNPADYMHTDLPDYDDYLLFFGIRESLKCSKSKGMFTPESEVQQGFQVSLEGERTSPHWSYLKSSSSSTRSFKTANSENSGNQQSCRLDALTEVCKTVED